MKHCTNCGHELEAGAKFCPNCGQATSVSEQVAEDGRASDATLTHQVSSDTDHEKTDEQVTPRIPEQQQPTTKSTKTQNNTVIAIALVVLVILGGFFFVKNRVVVSRDRLASNITKAVQKQDGKLFLKQFSKDDQALKFSDVGASSVVKDIHNHSRDSLSETGRIIVDGQRISGTEVRYRFSVESKKVLGLFTSYYLTTRKTPVNVQDYTGSGGPVTIKLKDADNQQITKQQLNNGFFPGKYNFDVRSGDTQGDYWIWASGNGETIDLTLTSSD